MQPERNVHGSTPQQSTMAKEKVRETLRLESQGVREEKPDGGGNNKFTGKLYLAKSFKSALTTHVKLSDKEAEFIMENIERENDLDQTICQDLDEALAAACASSSS